MAGKRRKKSGTSYTSAGVDIDDDEMYRVFNMGLGMVVVSSPQDVERLLASLRGAQLVGEVVEGQGEERVLIE